MIGVAMIVGFSFQGTELIGIAAGESENPEKNIPRAVRQVFWRILLFYVFAILIISLIIPYTDPSSAAQRCEGYLRQPVHPGVPACWFAVGGGNHERRYPDCRAVGG